MGASTLFKRAHLRTLFSEAKSAGSSLIDHLNAQLLAKLRGVSSGTFISQTSGNGHSVTLMPQPGGLTPLVTVELLEELITLYETAAAHLDSAVEAEIYAEMLALLQPCTEVYADYSQLRTGPVLEVEA